MDLSTLSAGKLNAVITNRADRLSVICKALIAAGRAMERGSETLAKAEADPSDKLAVAYRAAFDLTYAAYAELEARRRYHGSDKPIRRKTA